MKTEAEVEAEIADEGEDEVNLCDDEEFTCG